MPEFASFIIAARTIGTLHSFMENGGFAQLLSEVELNAAGDALSKSALARNPAAQIHLAIGHLESAWHAMMRAISDEERRVIKTIAFTWGHAMIIDLMYNQVKFIGCVMCACYLYLDEIELARAELRKLESFKPKDKVGTILMVNAIGFVTALPVVLAISYSLMNSTSYKAPTNDEIKALVGHLIPHVN